MNVLQVGGRTYEIDDEGFLLDLGEWDPDFALVIARAQGMTEGLTAEHWEIIHFVQGFYRAHGRSPLVYELCRARSMSLGDLRRLFPGGYLRGVCKLAGLSYHEALPPVGLADRAPFVTGAPVDEVRMPAHRAEEVPPRGREKVYRVDASGYLVSPSEWDTAFAVRKAAEIQPGVALTDVHFELIEHLRITFESTGRVPSVYEACQAVALEVEELERLFPRGYHRGAVKIAGLRAW